MALSPRQKAQNKQDFLDILYNNTEIFEGSAIINYLNNTDFWDAPASTRFHECYEGGLVEHSLKVYKHLNFLNYQHFLHFPQKSVVKSALFHDLCKVNFYKPTQKNKKMVDGTWVRERGYTVQDDFPVGHGEKSVIILLENGVDLTQEEMMAIRWHMGAYTDGSKEYISQQAITNAQNRSKLVSALQIADQMAVWLD